MQGPGGVIDGLCALFKRVGKWESSTFRKKFDKYSFGAKLIPKALSISPRVVSIHSESTPLEQGNLIIRRP